MVSVFKSVVRQLLEKAGYTIHAKHLVKKQDPDSMESALQRLRVNGINPGTVIDVGAAQGIWTRKALECWPGADYELIEPLHEQKEQFKDLHNYPNVRYHLCVAGEASGVVDINISQDLDGSGIYGSGNGIVRSVKVITINEITVTAKKPFVIKLDTHGYEMPILKGAASSLQFADALIIEVYGFHISPTCLTFHELSAHLKDLGFRLFDIVEVMRRSKDNAFWQADAIYLRNDHPVFLSNEYA
jgi:FkbM family methyltransferase